MKLRNLKPWTTDRLPNYAFELQIGVIYNHQFIAGLQRLRKSLLAGSFVNFLRGSRFLV